MATTVVKTIGTGGDYTTLQAWEDASPANLVTSDVVWQGQCFNQEFFSSSAGLLNVSGSTTDATRYKELTTYAGASFADNASVQTNALRYNASNGAGIRNTYAWAPAVSLNESYFRISNLQLSGSANAAFSSTASDGLVVDKCIFEASSTSVEPFKAYGTGTIKNSLFIQRSTNLAAALSNGANAYNCTFVRTGTGTANIIRGSYATSTFKNCAFFGAAATLAGGSTSKTYTTCYTDTASPPSGCTTVAYDTSTGSGFQNKTDATRDFRIKTGSALLDVGTTDTTNAAVDIAGTSRPQGSAYDVGAWELAAAGGAGNASGSFSAIAIAPPTATGAGSAAASGSLASVSIAGPTATASGSAAASGSLASVSVAAPTATASGSAAASGSLASVSITGPTATASGGAAGNASASPDGVTLTPPTATATGSASASATPSSVSITPPTATASAGGTGNAFAAFMALVLSPAAATASGGASATGLFSGISLMAPAATAYGGSSIQVAGSITRPTRNQQSDRPRRVQSGSRPARIG